jgi:hypothetical protein
MPRISRQAGSTVIGWLAACAGLLTFVACGGAPVPDPKLAARAYADAVRRGDAQRLYELLTPRAQQALGRDGTARLLSESRGELDRTARAVGSPRARVEAIAEARFNDGESARLVLESGRFLLDATTLLPARPRTPSEALSGLRRALSRRSYPALMALLAADSGAAIESDLGALVTALEHPETLDIQVNGDAAEVQVPSGHVVRLKREGGIWRVLDFD